MTNHIKRRIAKKRRKPKRPGCNIQRCKRRVLVLGLCRPHAEREADHLFSLFIRNRDKRCTACGRRLPIAELQCSHHLRRGLHWVRYDPDNAVAHCAPCHVRFTHAPELHHEWIVAHVGKKTYARLMDTALGPIDPKRQVRMPPGPFGAEQYEKVLVWLRYGQEEVA